MGDSSASPPAPRPRRSDLVADHVREEILGGRLRAGTFVRPDVVAAAVGVSATPGREGLLRLQSEGFLRMEPRRGFRVLPLSMQDLLDTFTAQSLLAGELAARAAHDLTAADLRRLTAVQEELEEAADAEDLALVEQHNHRFHRDLYALVDAPRIKWLLKATLAWTPRRYYAEIGGWADATRTDHRRILEALRQADESWARAEMASHIQRAGELLARELQSR